MPYVHTECCLISLYADLRDQAGLVSPISEVSAFFPFLAVPHMWFHSTYYMVHVW